MMVSCEVLGAAGQGGGFFESAHPGLSNALFGLNWPSKHGFVGVCLGSGGRSGFAPPSVPKCFAARF
jgi:hypothetical protein